MRTPGRGLGLLLEALLPQAAASDSTGWTVHPRRHLAPRPVPAPPGLRPSSTASLSFQRHLFSREENEQGGRGQATGKQNLAARRKAPEEKSEGPREDELTPTAPPLTTHVDACAFFTVLAKRGPGHGGGGSFLITPHISGPGRQGRPFPESLAAGSSELQGTSWSITGRKAPGGPGTSKSPQDPQNIQDKRLRSPLAFN